MVKRAKPNTPVVKASKLKKGAVRIGAKGYGSYKVGTARTPTGGFKKVWRKITGRK